MSGRPVLARTLLLAVLLATVAVTPLAGQPTLAQGVGQQALSRHRRRPAVLLARRHGVGTVPSAESRGRDPLSARIARSSGFTVIQAVALAEFDGLNDAECLRPPAARRQRPDARPPSRTGRRTTTGITWTSSSTSANALGLYIGFLPTWGDKWNQQKGVGPEIFTPENARRLRRVARHAATTTRRHHLDSRRRPPGRERHAPGNHPRDGARPPRRATAART